jgi:hypothetical protein
MKRAWTSESSPGRPRGHFVEGQLGEERDAVEALLAVGLDVVAEVLEGLPREGGILDLDLLEADDVGLHFADPLHGALDPGADAIDVPGRDSHAVTFPR